MVELGRVLDELLGNNLTTTRSYDALDRAIQVQTKGFTPGATVYRDTRYDTRGRVIEVSRPYYPGGAIALTRYEYDALDRVTSETTPDGTETRHGYNGLSTTTTVAPPQGAAQTRTSVRDSQGQVVSVTDALGGTVTHQYGPFGTLVQTRDPAGNATTLTWDRRGRKTQMADPDMGTWSYVYNALGELTRQTDPRPQTTYLTYDLLGRLTKRSEPDLLFNWYYDTDKNGLPCGKGLGKLCQVGVLDAGNHYQRTHTYDNFGRPQTTTVNALGELTRQIDAKGQTERAALRSGAGAVFKRGSVRRLAQQPAKLQPLRQSRPQQPALHACACAGYRLQT